MQSTIRFLRTNRYRKPVGSTDSIMGYGIHDQLVRRGIAEFVKPDAPVMPAATAVISEPIAETETDSHRERKSRRFHKEP